MSKLPLNFACWTYDRIGPLAEGRVTPDGIDLNFIPVWNEELFVRVLKHHEFDVTELSLSAYVVLLFQENPPFIAIPIFPNRVFRHSAIYINVNAGIKNPKDLIGKKVGIPGFRQTACVWIRGILAEHYGVPVDSVDYFIGSVENVQKTEGYWDVSTTDFPTTRPGIRITRLGTDKSLSEMLSTGELDAVYTARPPSCFTNGAETVRKLFPDGRTVERKYFQETGVYPIMHIVAIRREIYDKNPWVALSMYKALYESKAIALNDLQRSSGSPLSMLPWFDFEMEESVKIMGQDIWPYGIRANRPTLEAFLRYSHDQGLAKRLMKPEEIFAPSTAGT
jgi:4,5-dihydroxyphthalate decarboxylase